MTRRLVISALNIKAGGSLVVLRDCLASAGQILDSDWEIIALVHDQKLFDVPKARFLEYRLGRLSWLKRLYIEYWHFYGLSLQLKPDVWLSFRDISPRVKVQRQVVYCHNALPFFKMSFRHAWFDPKAFLHTLFYRFLYRLNIHRNEFVVVQQEWLRAAFTQMYGLKNVVVATPELKLVSLVNHPNRKASKKVFLYPSLARVHKNFEVICQAAAILAARKVDGFELRLTISANDNRYAASLARRYGASTGVSFIGHQDKHSLEVQYRECDFVIFSSQLETWGLPISEAKTFGKPIMVSDLAYAHETVGNYDKVAFFDPSDPTGLADLIQGALEGRAVFQSVSHSPPAEPFVTNWADFIRLVTKNL